MIRLFIAIAALIQLVASASAADFRPMISPDWATGAVVKCNEAAGLVINSEETEKGPVLRAETKVRFRSYWQAGVEIVTTEPVAAGDVLWIKLQARTVKATNEQREAEYVVYFQRKDEPWEKSVIHHVSVGSEWTTLELPFVAKHDFAAGEAALELGVGFRPQTIEFAGLELRNYGKTVQPADLPRTRHNYGGREADAAWRVEALARIEKLRKSPFTVTVLDVDGKPFPGAEVTVEQERSDFQFGTCVDSGRLLNAGSDGETYRKILLEYFNTAVVENGFKWPCWSFDEPADRLSRSMTLKALDWLAQQPLELRGHNLVWPGWGYTPPRFRPPGYDSSDLRRIQNAHIQDVVGATFGRMESWDVVNESLHERDYFEHMPEDESIDEWFRIAHRADPKPKLFLNDFEMLTGGDSRLIVEAMVKQAEGLKARGTPLHGLGVQGHFGQSVLPMTRLKEDIDLLATTGLPIVITEFDVNSSDEEFAADLLRDFLILCYSHPGMRGFIIWGFWESAHWIPQAAMFRSDWSERPSAKVWRDLVLTKWRTRTAGKTDEQGVFKGDGYHGVYVVKVTAGGRTETRRFPLGSGGASTSVFLTTPIGQAGAAEAASDESGILRNGSFGAGTQGWELEQIAPARGSFTVTQEGPNGTPSARIELLEPADTHWKMSLLQKGLVLRAGKNYRVSFMARGSQQRWVHVGFKQHLEPYEGLGGKNDVEIGATWQQVSLVIQATADESNARFSIGNLGLNPGTIWLTDFSVVEED